MSSRILARLVAALPVRKQLDLVAKAGMRLQPHDVGIGISQVLPVVVLAMDKRVDFAGIEQPELHVHPSRAGRSWRPVSSQSFMTIPALDC